MPAQTVVTKRPAAKPQDRKAPKPTGLAANPNAIDLGADDEGPVEYPVRFLRDDDQWYMAHMPKGTLALQYGKEVEGIDMSDLDAMTESIQGFVRLLFSAEDAAAIIERLGAPDDRLDLVHIRALINRISERVGGLPTT